MTAINATSPDIARLKRLRLVIKSLNSMASSYRKTARETRYVDRRIASTAKAAAYRKAAKMIRASL